MICPHCKAENDTVAENCFTCGRSLVSLAIGRLIGNRYEILDFLGKGGMGMIYKAHDRALDEIVALKTLRPQIASDADMVRRFVAEIKLARKIRHRNVCAIHDYGEDKRLIYISMEYIDGIDLKKILQEKGGFPQDEAFDVTIQAVKGLEAIHEVGVIHRDLKTHNIMLDSRGVVRLLDFGIAKQQDADTGLTGTGQLVGTPEYMSPEQVRGQTVDFRSDLYSLGIVIFEIFTGQRSVLRRHADHHAVQAPRGGAAAHRPQGRRHSDGSRAAARARARQRPRRARPDGFGADRPPAGRPSRGSVCRRSHATTTAPDATRGSHHPGPAKAADHPDASTALATHAAAAADHPDASATHPAAARGPHGVHPDASASRADTRAAQRPAGHAPTPGAARPAEARPDATHRLSAASRRHSSTERRAPTRAAAAIDAAADTRRASRNATSHHTPDG